MPNKKQIMAAVKEAIDLIEMGVTMKRAPAKKSVELPVPNALKKCTCVE